MSLPITSIIPNGDGTWTYSWAAVIGAPYYRIVLNGNQIDQIPDITYTYSGDGTDLAPPLEIAAGTSKTLSEEYPPYLILQWYGQANTTQFNVYQYVNSAWALQQSFAEGFAWVYTYVTGTLTDETSYQYGVSAQDAVGNESSIESYYDLVVCPPAPPDSSIVISYVPTGHQVQIAAAP